MRVSVVIPAYNRADLIGATLDSLLTQTRPPHEIVVVDDGSSDGTPDVVTTYGAAVKLICQDNAGAGAARNRGFAVSTGDAIHFMDSDDLSSPNSHEVQVAALAAGADMTYGPWLKARFADRVIAPEPMAIQQAPVPPGRPLDQHVLGSSWVTVFQPCLFRRTLVEAAGPYRTDLKPSEDTEMLYRLMRRARSVVHTPDTIVLYRVHPENQVSVAQPTKRIIDWAHLRLVLRAHAAERDDLLPQTLAAMRRAQMDAAVDVYPFDHALAGELVPGFTGQAPLAHRLDKWRERQEIRIRRVTRASTYGSAFAAGKITPTHEAQIGLMGYTIGKVA